LQLLIAQCRMQNAFGIVWQKEGWCAIWKTWHEKDVACHLEKLASEGCGCGAVLQRLCFGCAA